MSPVVGAGGGGKVEDVYRSSAANALRPSHNHKPEALVRLMDKILHDLKDSKLWELWYIPYIG